MHDREKNERCNCIWQVAVCSLQFAVTEQARIENTQRKKVRGGREERDQKKEGRVGKKDFDSLEDGCMFVWLHLQIAFVYIKHVRHLHCGIIVRLCCFLCRGVGHGPWYPDAKNANRNNKERKEV